MKRIIIPLVLALVVLASCQTGKVTTALNQKEAGNIEEALEMINEAVDPASEKSEKTIGWPRTWEVRGEIYQSIYQSEDQKVRKLAENPLDEALRSYQKALELDEQDKFSNSVKIKLTLLINDLTNQAVQAFNDEDYNKALNSFENILELQDIPIMEEDSPGAVDTVIIFNAGLAAFNAENYDKAIKYYSEAAEYGYNGTRTYSLLANTYQLKGDTLGALDALKEGFEKYPDNNTILTSMIQVYLDLDKTQDAMKYLQLAIEQDPTNATYYFALGTLYEKNEQQQEAIEVYEEAIELDNDY
ncbi:MAG: tetratricopeptide repeat protein, partial [Bacteroidota bacterium]